MEDVRDPSFNVPPALLEHVHLLSSHRFPSSQLALPLDTIVDYLLAAPQIVRDRAAVSWQYIRPPSNGTIFLAWQPQSQLQNTFATDGYHWPEPEQQLQNDAKGYFLQIFIADSGYILGSEQIASHRRVRYRLTGSRSGDTVDSNLEIVHYLKGPDNKQIPVQNLPNNPQQIRLHKSRQYLENAGSLERKEFMLSDRTNWPKITMPGQRPPTMPPNYAGRPPGPGMPGFNPRNMPVGNPQPPFMAGDQSRQRRTTMGMPRSRAQAPGMDAEQEMVDEDAAAVGDALDNIRPRDISMVRFTQHQDFMEEVTSSAFHIGQIWPVDSITGGTSAHPLSVLDGLGKVDAATGQTEYTEDEVQELSRRISQYQQDQRAEIERLRSEAGRLKERKTAARTWIKLHDALRDFNRELPNKGIEDDDIREVAEEALTKNDRGEYETTKLEAYLARIEKEIGYRIEMTPEDWRIVRKDTRDSREPRVIRKGGMLTREELLSMQSQNDGGAAPAQDEFNEFTNMDTATEALDFYNTAGLEGFDGDQGMTFMEESNTADFT